MVDMDLQGFILPAGLEPLRRIVTQYLILRLIIEDHIIEAGIRSLPADLFLQQGIVEPVMAKGIEDHLLRIPQDLPCISSVFKIE